VAAGHTFTTIDVGYHSSCALTVQGRAYCWGLNEDGALGTGTTENARAPVPVAGGLAFSALSVSTHSCALTSDGEVYCWGANTGGQLGNGEGGFRVHSTAPVRAQTDLRFAAISVGANKSCALTSAGVAHCWGLPGQRPSLPRPALEENLRFRQLHVGGELTCGIVENGVAYCWETWSRLPPYSAVRLREPQRP
jgi:alpha-tubulin suppressor-like RCC1 family protein